MQLLLFLRLLGTKMLSFYFNSLGRASTSYWYVSSLKQLMTRAPT